MSSRPSRFHDLDLTAYALPADFGERFHSPGLVIYLDHVRENLRRVVAYAGGDVDRWRAHVKSTKIPAVFAELARAGLRHFKTATTRELRHLLEALEREGVDGADVLMAYPLRPPALGYVGRLAEGHPGVRVSVLCEDPGLVGDIPPSVSVFADVNPGMNRTGIPGEDGATLAALARAAGPRFRGVHYYDGHLYEGSAESRRADARTQSRT